MQLYEFFKKELEGVGFSGIDIKKTPIATRITIKAARPGLVIGKKGSKIKNLTEVLSEEFRIENPQVDVEEVTEPELDAQIMAERLAMALEKGQHYRRAGYGLLRRIMRAGAEGCEIVISGKITSQRARYQKMRQGIIIKTGEPTRDISYGVAHAKLKAGILGVRVKILPPNYYNPKKIEYLGRRGLDPEILSRIDREEEEEIVEEEIEAPAAAEEEIEVVEEGAEEVIPAEEVPIDLFKDALRKAKIKGKIADDEELLEDTIDEDEEDLLEFDEDAAAQENNEEKEEEEVLEEDKPEE